MARKNIIFIYTRMTLKIEIAVLQKNTRGEANGGCSWIAVYVERDIIEDIANWF